MNARAIFSFFPLFFVVVPDVASIQSEDDDVMMIAPDAFGIRFQCRLRRRLFNDTDLIDVLFFFNDKKNQEYKLMKKKMAEMKALEEQQAKQQQEKE